MSYSLTSPPDQIDARPSKDLFVGMITRDITVTDAIMDFVDNSVDQARRTGLSADAGLAVAITLESQRFVISDNCGGMTIDVALNKAFRFGRPHDVPFGEASIGRFGIGMKRAFFKLGQEFTVSSRTTDESFEVSVDVPAWVADANNWSFPIKSPAARPPDEGWFGYRVEITRLHPTVALTFSDQNAPFVRALKERITSAHQKAISDGLSVSVNGSFLVANEPRMKVSDSLRPVTLEDEIALPGRAPIKYRIVAGLGERDPKDAGWYVYCNGRLITRADKTVATGWGETEEGQIPQYHNNYAWFRGYVFLNCDDPDLLPWNTVKSGLDTESPTFMALRPHILAASRQILDFMRKLATETANEEEAAKPLQEQINDAPLRRVYDLELRTAPVFPTAIQYKAKVGFIRFSRPLEKINAMKKLMGVTRPGEVGERAFDYYYENEVE